MFGRMKARRVYNAVILLGRRGDARTRTRHRGLKRSQLDFPSVAPASHAAGLPEAYT